MKPLEALDQIVLKTKFCDYDLKEIFIIQEALEVLEIIKKYVSFQETYDDFFKYDVVDKQYISSGSSVLISDKEYKKLKEFGL